MNPFEYDEARRQAQLLEGKLKDLADNPSDPAVRNLLDTSRSIEDMLQVKANPRSIEDKAKGMIKMIDNIDQSHAAAFDPRHLSWLRDQYENLQMSLRKFENY